MGLRSAPDEGDGLPLPLPPHMRGSSCALLRTVLCQTRMLTPCGRIVTRCAGHFLQRAGYKEREWRALLLRRAAAVDAQGSQRGREGETPGEDLTPHLAHGSAPRLDLRKEVTRSLRLNARASLALERLRTRLFPQKV
ncbi:unnamed protein product [Pleuronectes platessa]|uniref:Uncharacterized protein n=1 Tax=Pleuronectes platessa TaxID=8262 RepID=A0A9N7UC64_PLEPL|nr:unnamed protein product [Pleuronectes platessa]